jgi:hypothetical protein
MVCGWEGRCEELGLWASVAVVVVQDRKNLSWTRESIIIFLLNERMIHLSSEEVYQDSEEIPCAHLK